MKVLLLSDATSPHTIKWAKSLANREISIGLFSLSNCNYDIYKEYPNITLYMQNFSDALIRCSSKHWQKLKYLKTLFFLQNVIRQFSPDIVHAHYASSYGLLGALSGFKPYVISVWGSDVFDFPHTSFLHKLILQYNLLKANVILSTSNIMAREVNLYTNKPIEVTPFGIDIDVFKPKAQISHNIISSQDIVIGTVKALEEQYGIEYLIRAFAIVKEKNSHLPLKLLIVGGGSQEQYLKNLAKELLVFDNVIFAGKIPYDEVIAYHNMLSVSVFVSNSDSFGVAVIEASACEKPVVVSRVGGLPEVVDDGVTGFIVEPRNPEQTAVAIEKLVLNTSLRMKMGQAGRERVKKLFNWQDNVDQMICIYRKVSKKE